MSASFVAAKAIKARWDATAAITSAIPGTLQDEPAIVGNTGKYATMEVKKGPRKTDFTTGDFYDYRHVIIKIYGVGKESVDGLISTIRQAMESTDLTLDSGTFLRLEPLTDTLAKAKDKRDGDKPHVGQIEWCLWSQRSQG